MQDLANRLTRMKKHLGKWARRRGTTCYRLYEKDIPEYPFVADLYEDHMILTELASEAIQSRRDYDDWKKQATELFRSTWDIRPENMHFKTRFKRAEGEQYEKLAERDGIVVNEAGLKFSIYPDNWLDTGLFLDHRNLRSIVREQAAGKKVLNLFCYTGSFSVYAAAGGASLVHSVDLSARYLTIVEENLQLNALTAVPHEQFRLDAREFLSQAQPQFYDFIICDAPVFSKSRKQERDFDVLRDSPQLVRDSLKALQKTGVLYFSTNFRKFSLRFDEKEEGAVVKNISAQTIPEDFRNKWIHTCYEIRHGT